MTLEEALHALEASGTADNRKALLRHGAKPPLFGVNATNLRKIARAIGFDRDLADALWKTGIPDARHLAIFLVDPKTAPVRLMDSWVAGIDYSFLADHFVRDLVAKSQFADNCLKWTRSHKEWPGRAGYMLLATLLDSGEKLGDERLRGFIRSIEYEIHASKNRVRDAMLHALVAIGCRVPALRAEVVLATKNIGMVEVDLGKTKCRKPDVIAEIKAHLRRTSSE
ncbi:MAG: DNA alkylation repair protein [Bryobacterales bacterium]|nr:DNA alkylation repair protein [Bryobacterales bacterium]